MDQGMGMGAWFRGASSLRAFRGALARRFLIKLKRATHRGPPELIVPTARRVLVVAPHMDDEVIPCGGTLILLAEQDAEIHVIFVTDSSAGLRPAKAARALSATRRAEAQAVSEMLGFTFNELGFPDGQLHKHEEALAKRLTQEIDRLGPDLIFCPFPSDAHSDHMSCASALARAASEAKPDATIMAYEVWTPLWPNVAVDISDVAQRKEEAIRPYRSQLEDRDHAAAALGLNRFRGLSHSIAFAEAFFRTSPADFVRLTALLDEI
jgi:LmbE family N-acetylglucosaminyl deacetylase